MTTTTLSLRKTPPPAVPTPPLTPASVRPSPDGAPSALHLAAKSIKVTLVIPPEQLAAAIDPASTMGRPQIAVTIAIADPPGRLRCKLNAKSLRRALGTIAEHGPAGVACVLQGRLAGQTIDAAGLSVQPKGPRDPAAEDAMV